mgnify:FL=1
MGADIDMGLLIELGMNRLFDSTVNQIADHNDIDTKIIIGRLQSLLTGLSMSEPEYRGQKTNEKSHSENQQSTLSGKPTTKIVNVKKHGREGVTMIDRGTIFGNKFILKKDGGDYTRKESVERYREWFKHKVEEDAEFRKSVHNLIGEILGCWCKPKDCHGDIILQYLRGKMEIKPEMWDSDGEKSIQTKISDFHNE